MTSITKSVLLTAITCMFSMSVHAAAVLPGGVINCDVSELTTSTSCVGVYDPGNDNGAHSIFDDATFQSYYGTGWTSLSKVEDPSWGVGALGLTLTGQGGLSGTWQVDSNAWDSFAQGDILAILKAGNDAAAYELNLNSTSGTWTVSGDAWKEADNHLSALSHFSLWSKTSITVPEPSSLALLVLGVLGLRIIRRQS